MTLTTATATRPHLSVKALAARWGVSVDTARNRTRTADFPPPISISPRCLRWPEEEVVAWEHKPQSRQRRIVTGSLPQHRTPPGQARIGRPMVVKMYRSPAA